MITPFNNFGIMPLALLPAVLPSCNAYEFGLPNFNMNSFFQGWDSNFFNSPTEIAPNCTLNGRVKIHPSSIEDKKIQKFFNNYEVEVSTDEERIEELANNINQANYTKEMLTDDELPALTFAALIQKKISILDATNVLIWRRLIKDYPEHDLKIYPIYDENGGFTQELYDLTYQELDIDGMFRFTGITQTTLESALKTIPKSQQVLYKFTTNLPESELISRLVTNTRLSIDAQRIFASVKYKRNVGIEPRLGVFTKEDIAQALISDFNRLYHIPVEGVPFETSLMRQVVTPSRFSGHDLIHWYIIHHYSPTFCQAMLELVVAFRELTKVEMSNEIWRVVDLDLEMYSLAKDDRNKEFEKGLSNSMFVKISDIWAWNIVLHMRKHRSRWQKQYEISIDNIGLLSQKNDIYDRSKKYLKNYTDLTKIYLLQKIDHEKIHDHVELNEFFQKPFLSQLSVECPEYGACKIVKLNDQTAESFLSSGLKWIYDRYF